MIDVYKQLLKVLCRDLQNPTRHEIDPSALITHSVFENDDKWKGFPVDHPLGASSKQALSLYKESVEARHNMIYRPFLLEERTGGILWQDCTLRNLISHLPNPKSIESAFSIFLAGMKERIEEDKGEQNVKGDRTIQSYAVYFLHMIFLT